jgi:hypothetical protein
MEFTLLEINKSGEKVSVKYRGAWPLIDNVSLSWPTIVPPFKNAIHTKEVRFSKWLESIRKDVECTFGIMKG